MNSKNENPVKLIGIGALLIVGGFIGVAIFNALHGREHDYTYFTVVDDWSTYIALSWVGVVAGLAVVIYGAYSINKAKKNIETARIQAEDGLRTDSDKAKAGDADAQFSLGMRYYKGDGTQRDYAAAYQWWMKAAEQGHKIAQYNLGIMNEHGESVPKSDEEAFKWYSLSAKQKYHSALNKIGEFCRDGRVLPQSDTKAFGLFEFAAKDNNTLAQYNLGIAYLEGKGCEPNRERAINFLSRAAEGNNAPARLKLDELLGGKSGF